MDIGARGCLGERVDDVRGRPQFGVAATEIDERLGLKLVASWTLRGQWMEIHARY